MSMEKTAEQPSQKRIARAGFFWNAAYSGLNSVESAILLLAIARKYDITVAGMITIGFAIGTLAAIMARYGIRNYQVTDVYEKFRFPDYLLGRILSVAGTLAVSLGYLAFMTFSGRYSPDKGLIILEIILLKIVGAFEDVYVGRLQQKGRLDIGGRIAAFRLGVTTLVVFVAIWVIPSLPVCLLMGIVTEVLLDMILLPTCRHYADFSISPLNRKATGNLLKVGIPLCVGMALYNYAGNAPKYLVDMYLTDDMQAVCGYVMMPMFVLSILNAFVMQPAVKGLGDAWNTDRGWFWKKVRRHILLIGILSVAVLGAGLVAGLPLLSMLYKVDLRPYRKEFLVLMAGGGLYTVSAYLIILLTTMRRQNGIVWGCVAAALIYLGLVGLVIRGVGFIGVCWLYIAANAAMSGVYLLYLRKGRDRDQYVGLSGKNAASDSGYRMDQKIPDRSKD